MDVTFLPSSASGPGQLNEHFLSTNVVNRTVALDAGSLGFALPIEAQMQIRHVLLTHSHLDHVASIPIFLENIDYCRTGSLSLHAGGDVVESLRRDMFNGRLWPDVMSMEPAQVPFPSLLSLEAGRPLEVEGLRITPVAVDHVVPTFGFVVEGPEAAFILATDTGPTRQIWEVARETPNLRAVFLDCAFPDELEWLAKVSRHLCPSQFAQQAALVPPDVRIIAIHLKPRYHRDIVRQLHTLHLANLEIAQAGRTYTL